MPDVIITRRVAVLCLIACGMVITTIMATTKYSGIEVPMPAVLKSIATAPTAEDNSPHFIKQRNDVSKILNDQKKMYGQQSCHMIKLRKKAGEKVDDDHVSENGGWCMELSGSDSKSHRFDEGFARALSEFLSGKRVGSFGDGPGDYKKALDSYKQVAGYTAYDGAPFCETTTNGRVKFLDLSGPQFGLPAYDWVVSVEVGEHIPAKFENIYLDNLARHAKQGIILSWAVPGQGGLSHVNNQPLSHVIEQMNKRGFDIDKVAGEPLRKQSAYYWLKANIHVYRRIDPKSFQPNDA